MNEPCLEGHLLCWQACGWWPPWLSINCLLAGVHAVTHCDRFTPFFSLSMDRAMIWGSPGRPPIPQHQLALHLSAAVILLQHFSGASAIQCCCKMPWEVAIYVSGSFYFSHIVILYQQLPKFPYLPLPPA